MRHGENGAPEPNLARAGDAELHEAGELLDELRQAWPLPSVASLREEQVAAVVREARQFATGDGTGKPSGTPGGKPTVNPGRGKEDKPQRPTKSKTPKPERPGRSTAGESPAAPQAT